MPFDAMKPYDLNVLLVDNNITSLCLISRMLQTCHYQVTRCTRPTEALLHLRNDESKFDIVITEVNFLPDMNGLKFLEIVKRETDLPVVIVSAEDRIDIMISYITKGVCAYIPKPIRMEVVRFLWQHVARKEILSGFKQFGNVEDSELNSSHSGVDNEFCGSSDGVSNEDERNKARGRKHRLIWTDDLHKKFVNVVDQLGIQNAVPKKVLELMNVPGLSRGNVASHLQKYRLSLGKIAHMQQSYIGPHYSAGIATGTSTSMIEHVGSCLRGPPGMDHRL